ncbi:MAG: amidohydrolase [Sphaerochaetaceae bacterium]|jgi:5-methylthioadenosine/S-adenosylhomocysteine deaminase
MSTLLLKNADIIATYEGSFTCLRNSYLGIEGDTIDYIGSSKPTEKYDEEKDMHSRLLIPGLINSHGHSGMVLLRGLGSDLPLQDWLHQMWPIEDRMRVQDLQVGMKLAMLEMIATGTTSFSDMYLRPRDMTAVVEQSGMKANIARCITCPDTAMRYESFAPARESIELFKDFHKAFDDRLRIDFSIHAQYTITDLIARRYSEDCLDNGGRLHVHISETRKEHEDCISQLGKTPTRWFADLGTFKSPTAAAHCVWASDEDISIMAQNKVSVIHNPSSNMKLGSGFAPIGKMLRSGINVALGTDGAASNNNLNMLEEMHLASIIHKGYHLDPTLMKPETVLRMATANGALLQGRPDTGSLEVGKKADICAIDLDKPHLVPNLDPLALLTYSAQGSDVCMTMVNGRILYENGQYLTLDRERILREAEESARFLYGK